MAAGRPPKGGPARTRRERAGASSPEAFLDDPSAWDLFRWQHGPHRQGLPFLGTWLLARLTLDDAGAGSAARSVWGSVREPDPSTTIRIEATPGTENWESGEYAYLDDIEISSFRSGVATNPASAPRDAVVRFMWTFSC